MDNDLVEAGLRADRLRHDFAKAAQQQTGTAERAKHGRFLFSPLGFTNRHREATSTAGKRQLDQSGREDHGRTIPEIVLSKHSSFYMIFIADHGRELFHVSGSMGKLSTFDFFD